MAPMRRPRWQARSFPATTLPPVWPDKNGTECGMTLHPLYPTTPRAAAANPRLYELLVLVDSLRAGNPRERALALQEFEQRLHA